ncbi:MAG TPA: hypothetical protein PLD93_01525 [Synergistaceae bacterium]|nr:hypothetical protein [Synergistaceae bacterium]
MRHIEIDEEVFKYLQSHALPFVETPNDTLRRLFGVNKTRSDSEKPIAVRPVSFRMKRQKTRLSQLTKSGVLREGQKLILHDHRKNPVPGIEAFIRGDRLEWKGSTYSMTALAKKHLREICHYQSPEVQGPAHWYTEANERVFDLWKKYLEENENE